MRNAPFVCLSAIAGALLLSATPATSQESKSDPALEARIQRVVTGLVAPVIVQGLPIPKTTLAARMAALNVPGISIAVIRNGRIEWARGFGVTKAGGAPVTAETLFQAASISKPVTAMAVLRLVQDGKLDLDTDVNQYLKSWKVPDNNFTAQRKVTLRMLLNHTAGMRVPGFVGYAADAPVPTLLQVLKGERPPANSAPVFVDAVPGTAYRYSGGGYVVMQQVVEDVTGQPFSKIMQDSVLAPIGMTRSAYEQPLAANRTALAATAHDGNGKPVRGGAYTYPELSPAGLWSTPGDVARFAMEVQKALAGTSTQVLGKDMTAEMLKPGGLNGRGLGPQLSGSTGNPGFEHDGANEGFRSLFFAYNRGDGVVIMTNGAQGLTLANEIRRAVALEYGWPDFLPKARPTVALSPEALDRHVGHYRINPRSVTVIVRRGNQLFERRPGNPNRALFPESDGTFFVTDAEAQIVFEQVGDGRPTALSLRQGATAQAASRIDAADPLARWMDAVLARFDRQTPEAGSEAALRRIIEDLRAGQPNYEKLTTPVGFDMREWVPRLQSGLRDLGALRSLTFKSVSPNGSDVFQVNFEKGTMEWHLRVGADGLVENLNFSFE
jgi:CubicO group peptidase (beta-lactamase class C family)